jgi:hypothetical protein
MKMDDEKREFEKERRHFETLVAAIVGPLLAATYGDFSKLKTEEAQQEALSTLTRIAAQTALCIRERI